MQVLSKQLLNKFGKKHIYVTSYHIFYNVISKSYLYNIILISINKHAHTHRNLIYIYIYITSVKGCIVLKMMYHLNRQCEWQLLGWPYEGVELVAGRSKTITGEIIQLLRLCKLVGRQRQIVLKNAFHDYCGTNTDTNLHTPTFPLSYVCIHRKSSCTCTRTYIYIYVKNPL